MEQLIQLIETAGISAAMIGAFGWYILKKDTERLELDKEFREMQSMEHLKLFEMYEMIRTTNQTILDINKELAETNRQIVNDMAFKLNNVENNIIEIKNKLEH
ncbi:MAG: hypothetical protein HUJ88_11465 [Fusobacterium necrophorum]|nr:hypothetical protein [Fusobacterium necrophorum]